VSVPDVTKTKWHESIREETSAKSPSSFGRSAEIRFWVRLGYFEIELPFTHGESGRWLVSDHVDDYDAVYATQLL